MKASDVLIGAAEAIQEHGWCQGEFENEDGRLCVVGALLRVVGADDVDALVKADIALANATGNIEHVCLGPTATWNDLPYMTKEVVVSTLLQTAVEAAKAGE